jgi:hypothetical protein
MTSIILRLGVRLMNRLGPPIVQIPLPGAHSATRTVESLLEASGLRTWAAKVSVWSFVFLVASTTANAQLKEIGPPPFSQTVARQKIRTLLENVDPGNRQQTLDTLTGLIVWYRDILDEELIAAWKGDGRANLTAVIDPLADQRVAAAIVEFSWREQREAAFNLTYAPMLGMLMLRFPGSETLFLDDLLGPAVAGGKVPELSRPAAEAVCRILLDMPDVGTWKQSAEQILPHYRQVAESLLVQDLHGSDREKSYQAQVWLAELKSDVGDPASGGSWRRSLPQPVSSDADRAPGSTQASSVASAPRDGPGPAPTSVPPSAPPISAPAREPPSATLAPAAALPYDGPRSGTLECSAAAIPQNAEYVFRNLPLAKMQLDYDTRKWDARLAPGEGQTQRLILRNTSTGPQRRCVVHWSIIP